MLTHIPKYFKLSALAVYLPEFDGVGVLPLQERHSHLPVSPQSFHFAIICPINITISKLFTFQQGIRTKAPVKPVIRIVTDELFYFRLLFTLLGPYLRSLVGFLFYV